MPDPNKNPNVQNPAGWAVNQATAELYDVDDPEVILERARELVREADSLEMSGTTSMTTLTRVAKLDTGPRERGALGEDVPQNPKDLAIARVPVPWTPFCEVPTV